MKNIIVLETPEEIARAFNPVREQGDESLWVGSNAILFDNKGLLELVDGPENVEIGDVKTSDMVIYALRELHIDIVKTQPYKNGT